MSGDHTGRQADGAVLAEIPVVDVRDGGPVRHAALGQVRARALRDDCLRFFPAAVSAALPMLDRLARRWLTRSQSPYTGEIEVIAAALGFSGVWFLNGSYQWGCTALARDDRGEPWLLRTLDWPFPGLGRNVEVALNAGPAGEYYNVTWPGYVGALTGCAPGRFGASINQAPLFRRTRHPWLRLADIVINAFATWQVRHIPPDQLLRQVFETCPDYASARTLLEQTPVARPVIYTLVGVAPAERCVIERTETSFRTRETDTVAANDWRERRDAWEARIGADMVFTLSVEEAAANSRARFDALAGYCELDNDAPFRWLEAPVHNRYTRLAVELCPASGVIRVMGLDHDADGGIAIPVTQIRELGVQAAAA
jgi:hypothetical protein